MHHLLFAWIPLIFHGDFGPASSTDKACDAFFAAKSYVAQHHQAGSTGTISVLNFKSELPKASLHNVTFTGLLGPDGDFGSSKTIMIDGQTWDVKAEGLVSFDVIVAEVTAKLLKSGTTVCETKAEDTGFAR
jgi:hypothetical protein